MNEFGASGIIFIGIGAFLPRGGPQSFRLKALDFVSIGIKLRRFDQFQYEKYQTYFLIVRINLFFFCPLSTTIQIV